MKSATGANNDRDGGGISLRIPDQHRITDVLRSIRDDGVLLTILASFSF